MIFHQPSAGGSDGGGDGLGLGVATASTQNHLGGGGHDNDSHDPRACGRGSVVCKCIFCSHHLLFSLSHTFVFGSWFNYDLLSNPFHLHHTQTQIQMAEVAVTVNGGGISISGDTNDNGNGGEERCGYGLGLGLAKEDESGLATVSLNSIWTYYHCLLTS